MTLSNDALLRRLRSRSLTALALAFAAGVLLLADASGAVRELSALVEPAADAAADAAANVEAGATGAEAAPKGVQRYGFSAAPPGWLFFLILLPLLLGFTWATYRYTPVASPRWRWWLAGLRSLSLLIVLVVLFGPETQKDFIVEEKRGVAVLLDTSASMATKDAYPQAATRRDVTDALRTAGEGRAPEELSRYEIARALLGASPLSRLADEYKVFAMPFAESASPLALPVRTGEPLSREQFYAALEGLAPDGRRTDLARTLERSLAAWSGEQMSELFLLSDGRHNAESDPIAAANEAAAAGMRVYPVLIGDPSPPRNLSLSFAVVPPRVVLEGDQVSLEIGARATGYDENASLPAVELELTAKRIDEREGAKSFQASARAELGRDGAQRSGKATLVFPPLPKDGIASNSRPEEMLTPGIWRVDVTARALADEQRTTDNQVSTLIVVRDASVRVLYIERDPRWDYRYLSEMLKRADRKIVTQIFLTSATGIQAATKFPPRAPGGPSRPLRPLEQLPRRIDQLVDWDPDAIDIVDLAKLGPDSPERRFGRSSRNGADLEPRYHVVILGDVAPEDLAPDAEGQKDFLRGLSAFVNDGGGLLAIAGPFSMPRLFANTELASLLPVELLSVPPDQCVIEEPYRPLLELSQERRAHEIARLLPEPEVNLQLFEKQGAGLPALDWFYRVGDLKLGSEAVLRHPKSLRIGADRDSTQRRNLDVLAAVREIGRDGRVMWQGFDSTWLWRMPYLDVHQERWYRNAIRWLALNRLLHPVRALRLAVDEPEYRAGDAVRVSLAIDADYKGIPENAPRVEAWIQKLPPDPAGPWAKSLALERAPAATASRDGARLYRATVPGELEPGSWRVFLVGANRDERALPISFADFSVVASQRESEELDPDPALLAEIARRTGGELLEPSQLGPRLERLTGAGTIQRSTGKETPQPLWDNAWVLLLVFLLLCAEWILRKWVQLV
ncbi:MAG: VWA domain-containing protein [Planctomycetes bacterium]|nr:VWA domain-containing protein [Planctomycetota bacterium]